ncbi:MAG: LacI family DNA-binding transcriptional regulator [Anaerolineae bacterium]
MATMKEVAEYADVSVATVSRVINASGYVSPELIERVNNAMRELNYQPSDLARSLRRQQTLTVGILIPQLDHPFFSALSFAIEKSLFSNDYRTLICSAEENQDKERAYVEMLIRQRVDGVIFVPTGKSTENLKRFEDSHVPVVLVDRDLKQRQVDKVLSNNDQGGYEGMRYLLNQGHRRIAVIASPMYSEAMVARLDGAHKALTDHNVPLDPDLIITGSQTQFEMGYETAISLLGQPNRPTAIFALTDVIAIGVMHAAAKLGLHLPQDLSVMGFDNIPLAAFSIPELTTVGQPIYEMGEAATKRLLQRIQYPAEPHSTVMLENQLIIRNSVTQARPQNTA